MVHFCTARFLFSQDSQLIPVLFNQLDSQDSQLFKQQNARFLAIALAGETATGLRFQF
jgi:hypothetical protein